MAVRTHAAGPLSRVGELNKLHPSPNSLGGTSEPRTTPPACQNNGLACYFPTP
ncbi:hypothetical protein D4764_0188350 [Takifugu flavidus]|uniref:Uncharacterized protein n=1 Tax=Takifugu flavidus TaxID=433684 RepID=A0A5C6MF68_9TELE|nr:hypothetical protein D4764_0188350 [Takifugu flavidus]